MYGLRSASGPIPLKEIKVTATVSTFTAEILLEQRFTNDSDAPLEVQYKFPLDDGSTIYHFEAVINDKTLVGKVQEKTKAEQTYSDAISAGKGAYLLSKESEDLFSMSVGNLPPNQSVIIRIRYVTELDVKDDSVIFGFMHNIFPEYKGNVELEVELQMAFPIVDIRSMPSGKAITYSSIKGNKCQATISTKQSKLQLTPEQLTLHIKLEQPHQPQIITELSPDSDTRAYALHFFPSTPYRECEAELLFVLDRSGSMRGHAIEMVKLTMYQVLKHLPHTATFNIVGFGSDFKFLFPESLTCNPKSIRQARKHISTLEADLGGTDLHKPMQAIFKKATQSGSSNKPTQILFVLTDGAIENKDAVIKMVGENSQSRVFALGIGNNVDKQLVEGLATSGKGTHSYISGQSEEEMERQVLSMLHTAVEPAHQNVTITWHSKTKGELTASQVQQAPFKLPPVFNKQLYTVYGMVKCSDVELSHITLEVNGISGSHKFKLEASKALDTTRTDLLLHRLAANTLIREIEEKSAKISEIDKKSIIDLSVKYNIASTYASFVIVEDREETVNETMEFVMLQAPKAQAPVHYPQHKSANVSQSSAQLHRQLDEVRNQINTNLASILNRGESIETLLSRSEDLSFQSKAFMKSASSLRSRKRKQNITMGLLFALIILLLAFLWSYFF